MKARSDLGMLYEFDQNPVILIHRVSADVTMTHNGFIECVELFLHGNFARIRYEQGACSTLATCCVQLEQYTIYCGTGSKGNRDQLGRDARKFDKSFGACCCCRRHQTDSQSCGEAISYDGIEFRMVLVIPGKKGKSQPDLGLANIMRRPESLSAHPWGGPRGSQSPNEACQMAYKGECILNSTVLYIEAKVVIGQAGNGVEGGKAISTFAGVGAYLLSKHMAGFLQKAS